MTAKQNLKENPKPNTMQGNLFIRQTDHSEIYHLMIDNGINVEGKIEYKHEDIFFSLIVSDIEKAKKLYNKWKTPPNGNEIIGDFKSFNNILEFNGNVDCYLKPTIRL